MEGKKNANILTTSHGHPVDDNQNSLTAGEFGPILIQDTHLFDKLAHFDRERIPERVIESAWEEITVARETRRDLVDQK